MQRMLQRILCIASLLTFVQPLTAAPPKLDWKALDGPLRDIVTNVSKKFNCSISLAVHTADSKLQVAAGMINDKGWRPATTTDRYAWGSVTKSLTGASIMSMIGKGKLSLNDTVAPLVDPLLAKMRKSDPSQNFSSMADLWGEENVKSITIRQLLAMKSGIPDFDTAKPTPTGQYVDPLRASLYEHPKKAYSPTELMNEPWVRDSYRPCVTQFAPICYSSTNFMLLGLVLAQLLGESSWKDLKQSTFLTEALKPRIDFVMTGTPAENNVVHGFDRTKYNMPSGEYNNEDVGDVNGVFSGWTASNLLASPETVAELAWEIYGPNPHIAPKHLVDEMIPHGLSKEAFYGLATFNLAMTTGHNNSLGRAYGHLGATYGYQSIMGYFPELEMALVVASDIETDDQAQPSTTICLTYNYILSKAIGKELHCYMQTKSFYLQTCVCENATAVEEAVIV